MKKYNYLIDVLQLITFGFLIYLIILRFSPRVSRYLFENSTIIQGFVYELLLVSNLLILIYVVCNNFFKSGEQNVFIADINTWLKKSHEKFMHYLIKIPNIDFPISYMTHYLIKIPIRISELFYFGSRLIFLFVLCIDVFYFNRLYLSFKIFYILLIPLIISFCVELSLYFNGEVSKEISTSIVICKYERAVNGEPLLLEDYELTEKNTQFSNVEHAINVRNLIMEENEALWAIKDRLDSPIYFKILIRLIYISIWSYILYYYPLPIIKYTFTVIYRFLVQYPQLFFIITISILYLTLKKKI